MQVNLLGNVVDDRTGTVNVAFEINDILNNIRYRGDLNVSQEEYNKAFMQGGIAPLVLEKLSKSVVGDDSVSKGVTLLKEQRERELQKLTMELTMMIAQALTPQMPPLPEDKKDDNNTDIDTDTSSVDTE
ncbi:hypothetical protein [Lagierella massiliensis]|uniref:hypothetical protein n=1 Tax=Lagierella massiliensis TaxID=1689303 RepID=UPI0006D7E207|nr:hypothetical protein [Lagierella massiliensis]